MKKIFWVILFGLFLMPLISLAKESYSICTYQDGLNYVGSYGKCCPAYYPLYCDTEDKCCRKITLDEDGHCNSCLDPWSGAKDPVEIFYDGLVPCGRCLQAPSGVSPTDPDKEKCGDTGLVYVPCELCHLFIMVKAVLDFVTKNVFYLAVFMIVLAGGMFIFSNIVSPGNPQLINSATKIISSTLIGLLVFFAAYLIINLFFNLAGVVDIGLGRAVHEWFEIRCLPHLETTEFKGDAGIIRPPECQANCLYISITKDCPGGYSNKTDFVGGRCCCPSGTPQAECPGKPRIECNAFAQCYYCGQCRSFPVNCSLCNGLLGDCSQIDECHYCSVDNTCLSTRENCPSSSLKPCPSGTIDDNGLTVVPCDCEGRWMCHDALGPQGYGVCANWSRYSADCLAWSGSDDNGNLFECDVGKICQESVGDCTATCVSQTPEPLDCTDHNGDEKNCPIDKCHYCDIDDTCRIVGEDCPTETLEPCADLYGCEDKGCEECDPSGPNRGYRVCEVNEVENCLSWQGYPDGCPLGTTCQQTEECIKVCQ